MLEGTSSCLSLLLGVVPQFDHVIQQLAHVTLADHLHNIIYYNNHQLPHIPADSVVALVVSC